MATLSIIKGDSYAKGRPIYTYSFVDSNMAPYDLAGCTIRTTYKPSILTPQEDPDDINAPIRHDMVIGEDGKIISTVGLLLDGDAYLGVVIEHFTSEETRQLPSRIPLYGDIRLIDALGETYTWPFIDTIEAVDTTTNRIGGA